MEDKILNLAIESFEQQSYDKALELFILSYQKEDYKQYVLDNIYSCYISGNEDVFRRSFRMYVENNFCDCLYEDCKIDFIPYKEGQYFLFDKELKKFCGKISVDSFQNIDISAMFEKNEFSDILVKFDWDYRKIGAFLKAAEVGHKVYAIVDDIRKALSFWKIPELEPYRENFKIFSSEEELQQYFHSNTAKYLPHLVFAEKQEDSDLLEQIIEEEHKYRLTPEGRNNSNVLLTIGIPTHNRGNLLLHRLNNLLTMSYDAEIEIVVAKNGNALYQEEYRKAETIQDARLVYYGVDEELLPHKNWYNVVKYAHGEYVLFVSDEDDVDLGALEHYLKILSTNKQLSIVRAETRFQYAGLQKEYGKRGIDAFRKVFLKQNYLSGLTVNREKFMQADVLQFEIYRDNKFYQNYPHEWWCAVLCKVGDYLSEPYILIEEQEAVGQKEYEEYEKLGLMNKKEVFDENSGLPQYSTYESRFAQFRGQVEFLQLFMDEDIIGIQIGLDIAIDKLAFLMNLARSYGYKKEQYMDMIDVFANLSMEAIDRFSFNEGQKIELLTKTKEECEYLIVEHNKLEINERVQEGTL